MGSLEPRVQLGRVPTGSSLADAGQDTGLAYGVNFDYRIECSFAPSLNSAGETGSLDVSA